jgi:predicted dienelactone hydrolase
MRRMQTSITRRALVAAGSLWPLAVRAVPAPQSGEWTDSQRRRRLPWLLRLPDGPGPWPWVLYSHGLGGSREGGARWGEAWAAGGIAVLHLQHPGSDLAVVRGGLQALRAAASAEQLIARVADLLFAIGETRLRASAGEAPWAQLQADALGVAGHSFGAVSTQALAGERFAGGQAVDEKRPRAFIAFSPSAPIGGGSVQQAFGGISRPFLGVTGSEDGDPFGSYRGGQRRAEVYEGLPPGRRALLWLDGADHSTCGGGRPPGLSTRTLQARSALALRREAAHQALVARVSTLWWQAHLAGDEGAAAALRSLDGLGPGDRWRMD